MPFDIQAARKEGVSDADIAGYLASKVGFDLKAAEKEGVSATDAADYLAQKVDIAGGVQKPSMIGDLPNPKDMSPPPRPSLEDIAKSGGIGLAKGAIGAVTLPSTVGNLAVRGAKEVGIAAHDYIADNKLDEATKEKTRNAPGVPGYDDVKSGIESVTGEFYRPKSGLGRYTSAATEAIPGAGRKFIASSIAGNLAAEGVGELTDSTPAKIAAALLTSGSWNAAKQLRGTAGRNVNEAIKDASPAELYQADALVKMSYAKGSPITGAEAIAYVLKNPNSKIVAMQRVAEDSTKGGPSMQKFMAQRTPANQKVMEDAVGGVGKPTDLTMIPSDAQKAAQGAISLVEKQRAAQTKPFYEQAGGELINASGFSPIIKKIDDEIERVGAGSDTANELRKLKEKITGALPNTGKRNTGLVDPQGVPIASPVFNNTTLSPMMQIYKETRDQIAKKADQEGALASSVKGVVKPINKEVGIELERQSKSLEAGNKLYADLSEKLVEPVKTSPVGKIADINPKSQNAMTRQFEGLLKSDNAAPAQVAEATSRMVKQDETATRSLIAAGLKNEFSTKMQSAKEAGKGKDQFVGSAWASAMNTPSLAASIKSLPKGNDIYIGLENAFKVLEAQGMRRQPYSSRDAISALSGGYAAKALRNVPGVLGTAWEKFRYGKDTKMLSKLLRDPDSVSGLIELAKRDPGSKDSAAILATMLAAQKAGDD